MTAQPAQQKSAIVVVPTKSVGLAVFLAVAFGPIGLLYTTVPGAIVMFLVSVVVGFVSLGLGLLFTWPMCGIWAFVAANGHNEKLLGTSDE